MSEHSAVVFLQQAHARAEELARAATPGPWEPKTGDPGDDEVCTVYDGERGDLVGFPVAYVRSGAGVCKIDQCGTLANMHLIASHADPVAVLRRVAAERELLAEHVLVERERAAFVLNVGPLLSCLACWGELYPCRTVLLLAGAWGWTEGS